MAEKIFTKLIDDMDDESVATETVRFALDGMQYEIDLTEGNASDLHKAFSPYIAAGRKVASLKRGRTTGRNRSSDSKVIRDWASQQGIYVSPRGRISEVVRNAYRAGHR